MGKNKKNKKNKQSPSEGAGNNSVSHNGTDKKKSSPKQSPKSQPPVSNKNKSHGPTQQQQTKARSTGTEKKSSAKCWLVVVLLSVAVAGTGVVFRNEIQEIAEKIFEHYIHPEVLMVRRSLFESSSDSDKEAPTNIPPSPEEPITDDSDSVEQQQPKQKEQKVETSASQPPVDDKNKRKEPIDTTGSAEDRSDTGKQNDEASKPQSAGERKEKNLDENNNKVGANERTPETQSSPPKEDSSKIEEVKDGEKPVVEGTSVKVTPSQSKESSKTLDSAKEQVKAGEKEKDKETKADTTGQSRDEGKKSEQQAAPTEAERIRKEPDTPVKSTEARKEQGKHPPTQTETVKEEVKETLAQTEAVKAEPKKDDKKTVPTPEKTERVEKEMATPTKTDTPKVAPTPGETGKDDQKAIPVKTEKEEKQSAQTEAEKSMQKPAATPAEPEKTAATQTKVGKNEQKVTPSETEADKRKEGEKATSVEKEAQPPAASQAAAKEETKEAGKATPSQTEKSSYKHASITNDEDFKFRSELDEADTLLEKEDLEAAVEKYDIILRKYLSSPRAHYGKGLTLDKLGFKYMSNEYLEQAIDFLARVLQLPDVPDELAKLAGRKLVDRQQFRGWGSQAVKTMRTLTQRFPDDSSLQNELGVSYLMIGQNERARDVFKEVLAKDSSNGFAKVHLGFIVYTEDKDLEQSIVLLKEGIDTGEPGTADGRFYSRLGDAYLRLGREPEARKYYKEGEAKGLFPSAWQRSLYNVDGLTARPWWTEEQTGYHKYLKLLKNNWKTIRDEGLAQINAKTGSFQPEDENLRDTGDWKQFTLYQQGRKNNDNCAKAPKTCELIDQIPDAKGCRRGQVKFSVMSPGIHVWPHVGPTNCRIRAHLGLVVPEGPIIRVVNETRTWKEGQFIIFDDSFEHEVWHEGSENRLVLIVDFWHPELTERQKRMLSPI